MTYTLRNIPADLDRVISDLAISAGKPKATFLREFLESSFHDVIDQFSLRSPLVATLDDALASELGAQVMTQRYGSHLSPAGTGNTRSSSGSLRKRSCAGC